MPNYLEQYTRFSQGITQSLESNRARNMQLIAQGLTARQRMQAERNQKEIERRAEMRSQIADDMRDFDGGGMWDWQGEMISQQVSAIGNAWLEGEINDMQYTGMIVDLGKNAESYKASYEASVGNPTSSKATDPTFWGVTKAMESTIAGKNPYEDADMVIKGMDGSLEDIEEAQKNLVYRFNIKNKGKSANQQVLGGEFDKDFNWILTVGDPQDPSSFIKIPVNEYMANDEGRNSFLPEFSDINFDTIQDYATSTQLKNRVGDSGGAREVAQWYNDEILTNEKFRRDVFNQLGSFYMDPSDQANFDAAKGMFRKKPVEAFGISANEDATELMYSDSPVSRKMKEMIDAGREMLVSEWTGRSESDSDTPRGERIRFDQVIPIEFNTFDAYQEVVEKATTTDPSLRGISPVAFSQLKPLTGLQTTMRMGGGEDGLVGATYASGQEFGELDGELIGKFEQKVEVEVPTVDPETAEKYRAANIPVPTETKFKSVYYYRKLNDSQKEAFYKEIGEKLNYPPGERRSGGEEYIYNKYVLEQ
jgi:hypothetical protein